MKLIKLNYHRDDGPTVGTIAFFAIVSSVVFNQEWMMFVGLFLFTLAGIEMMLRPSASNPDHGFGCLLSTINTIVWSICILEYVYSSDVARSAFGYIIPSSIILFITIYVLIDREVTKLQYVPHDYDCMEP